MDVALRECCRCLKKFPYSELERVFNEDWDKFIYFCRKCYREYSPQGRGKIGASKGEGSSFAEKYKNFKGKKEWWDK